MSTTPSVSNARPLPRHAFGIVGWKNSGKTTLLVELVRYFTARSVRVATVKHAHHNVDMDHPGKDSWRHRDAGAGAVLLATSRRLMLIEELRDAPEPPLEDLIHRLPAADLILVEGFKRDHHRKLEVSRAATAKPLIASDDDTVIALATDYEIDTVSLPHFDLNDVAGVAQFVAAQVGIKLRDHP